MADTTVTKPSELSRSPTLRVVWATAQRLLFVVGIILLWELFVSLMDIRSYLLPAPSAVWGELVHNPSYLAEHAYVTINETLLGFALAVVAGVLMAVVIVYSPYMRSVLLPGLVAFNAIPKVAIAPMLIIWLGLGMESKIAMAFLLSFFPIVINTATGMADVEPELLNLFRLMRASSFQTFLKVRLPNSLPAMFDGFKIALPIAIIGAVIGEFVGSQKGMGYVIVLAGANLNTELIFAAVIVIAVMSVILFEALVMVEKLLLKWRPSERKF